MLGLLFMATAMMALLVLYNQGQLIRHRVQLENTADATVYSVAKLAARNKNFAAYTNRAMVANEVSIGQIVALMSWGKHYRDINKFTKYPLYQTPIAPPSPVTFANVLDTVTIPYVIMGTGAFSAASVIANVWPQGISAFNSAIGVFQAVFTLSTLVAQFEAHQDVIEANQLESDNNDIYPSFLSFYFLAQNALLTYAGETIDIADSVDSLASSLDLEDLDESSPTEMVKSYFPGTSMAHLNSPKVRTGDTDEQKDETLEAYQYYASIVNLNRDDFTADRHWDVGASIPDLIPKITLDFGIVALTIDLDFELWFGIKNDGGAVYVANGGLDNANDIKNLGWGAIDVLTFGFEIDIGLFVSIRICLPPFGCTGGTLIDIDFSLPFGFPLGGATHQLISKGSQGDAKKILADWGALGTVDGPYGGDPDDDVNEGPLDLFHAQTLAWGQVTAPPIYGGPGNFTATYGGPPPFMSLDPQFREARKSYEYTVALAIDLDEVETSDSKDAFNIGNSSKTPSDDWLESSQLEVGYDRFDLDTCSRSEEASMEGLYQQTVWGSKRPMATISSAEAYFSNPMQSYDDGSEEPASLFSPFWDARLVAPSLVPTLIATGEIPYEDLLGPGVPGDAIGVTNWLMGQMVERIVDDSIDAVLAEVETPFDILVEPALDSAGGAVVNASGDVIDKLTDGLTDFVGVIGKDNCAG